MPTLSYNLINKIEREVAQVKYYDERVNGVVDQGNLETVDKNYYASEMEDQVNFSVQTELPN